MQRWASRAQSLGSTLRMFNIGDEKWSLGNLAVLQANWHQNNAISEFIISQNPQKSQRILKVIHICSSFTLQGMAARPLHQLLASCCSIRIMNVENWNNQLKKADVIQWNPFWELELIAYKMYVKCILFQPVKVNKGTRKELHSILANHQSHAQSLKRWLTLGKVGLAGFHHTFAWV